ncbi:hypothetical protein JSE7799_03473 [Jannaschia seosinensis]|uniref:HPt domain-containing protein n=1 Tax=Jannaschia seosinensis TaxID=313367 RepID=A0A0M7BF82_9RHOB|nr:hypothetical protein [Jannaschia seosinensis]CUH40738.1 hypothetical protein JSE7799_03473 [Jannaschia seosinensis]
MPRATSAPDDTFRPVPCTGQAGAPVATLKPRERMMFDHVQLATICDTYGERSEAFLATMLTDVELRARAARDAADDACALRTACTQIVELASTIGMLTMEHAAHGVLDAQARGDAAALAACLARLHRLAAPETPDGWSMDDSGPETVA